MPSLPANRGLSGAVGFPASSVVAFTLLAILLGGCGEGSPTDGADPGPRTGSLRVELATSGGPLPDSLVLRVGAEARGVAPTETLTVADLPVGPVGVALEGVPAWCALTGANPRTITVTPGAVVPVALDVACDPAAGVLPRGDGPAASATVGPAGGEVAALGPDGTHLILRIPPGALPSPTEIRVTPATFQGLEGVAASFVGGAIFEPSGLSFAVPATLVVTPAGGLDEMEFPMSFVVRDGGLPEWQVPRLDSAGTSFLVTVPHFSGSAVAEAFPGAWGDLVQALGLVPHATPFAPDFVRVRGTPGAVASGQLCIRVSSDQVGAEGPVPFPLARVTFLSATGPVRGFVPVDTRTDAAGVACARAQVLENEVYPTGSWVVGTAVVLPGATFEMTARGSAFFVNEEAPFALHLDPPVGAVSDAPLDLCARVTSREDPDRPVAGVAVHLWTRVGSVADVERTSRTGPDGRACATLQVELPDHEEGTTDVSFEARVGVVDPLVNPAISVNGEEGIPEIVFLEVAQVRPVPHAPLSLVFEGALSFPVGRTAPLCAMAIRGASPDDGRALQFRVVEGPGRFPGFGEAAREAQVTSGSQGPGQACVDFRAPGTDDEETAVVEVRATLRNGEERVTRATVRFIDLRPALDLTPVPATLTEDGSASRVCASLRDIGAFVPLVGAEVVFALDGPGTLSPPEGDPLTTDAEGLACVEYTAPDPLPEGTTPVTIHAEASSDDFQEAVAASVVVTLQATPLEVSVTATPTTLSEPGATSRICALAVRGASPEIGVPVRFSTTGPGTLSGGVLSLPTDGDGRSCVDYTAPEALPAGLTLVQVRVEAGAPATALERTVTVRLQGEEDDGGELPCAAGVHSGNLSVGPGTLGLLDGIGTVTGRLSLFGVFPNRVDLRALCEAGEQFLIRGSFTPPGTAFPSGLLLSGLRFVGRTVNIHNPENGQLSIERAGGLTELELPNLERVLSTVAGSTLGGSVVVDRNPDLLRVGIGHQGGQLRTAGIGVTENPSLQDFVVRSTLVGNSIFSNTTRPLVTAFRVQGNASLRLLELSESGVDRFVIADNPALQDIIFGPNSELDSLTVTGNQSLQSLAGIPCGTRILSGIFIEGNPQLNLGEAQALASGCWVVLQDATVIIR
jgi:hypothetical protein